MQRRADRMDPANNKEVNNLCKNEKKQLKRLQQCIIHLKYTPLQGEDTDLNRFKTTHRLWHGKTLFIHSKALFMTQITSPVTQINRLTL